MFLPVRRSTLVRRVPAQLLVNWRCSNAFYLEVLMLTSRMLEVILQWILQLKPRLRNLSLIPLKWSYARMWTARVNIGHQQVFAIMSLSVWCLLFIRQILLHDNLNISFPFPLGDPSEVQVVLTSSHLLFEATLIEQNQSASWSKGKVFIRF
jgi:hypothetical protein